MILKDKIEIRRQLKIVTHVRVLFYLFLTTLLQLFLHHQNLIIKTCATTIHIKAYVCRRDHNKCYLVKKNIFTLNGFYVFIWFHSFIHLPTPTTSLQLQNFIKITFYRRCILVDCVAILSNMLPTVRQCTLCYLLVCMKRK